MARGYKQSSNFDQLDKALHFMSKPFEDSEPIRSVFQFSTFLRSLFMIFLDLYWQCLGKDGKDVDDAVNHLMNPNDMKVMMLCVNFDQFLEWWYDQPAIEFYDDEHEAIWWDATTIAKLYEEWAEERMKERNNNESV